MRKFLIRRALELLPTVLGVSILVFLVMHLTPGGPLARLMANPKVRPSTIRELAVSFHLTDSWPAQYWLWLKGVVSGHWGYSLQTYQPVLVMIEAHLGPTLLLIGADIGLIVMVGWGIGLYQALHPGSWSDFLLLVLLYCALSIPTFFLGNGLLWVFAVHLGWFPAGGFLVPGAPWGFWDMAHHLVLPAVTLSVTSIATHARFFNESMRAVLRSDYVRAARARGLPELRIIWRHGVRNALLPVVTLLAIEGSGLVGGAIITESVFAWPGIGNLSVQAIRSMDYPLIMGLVLISALVVLFCNTLADLAYAFLDPRLRDDARVTG